MFSRPLDAPPPVGPVSATVPVQEFRQAWNRHRSQESGSQRHSLRRWMARLSGRSDRHLLLTLADAVDAVVSQCDQLAEHLGATEAVTADTGGAFGEELTRLRAEVLHLQNLLGRSDDG